MGVFLALQASAPLHLGLDILDVVRHVSRLLDGVRYSCPAELLKDGDFVLLIDQTLELRERDTVRVAKVEGHADEDMVQAGRVRKLDRIGHAVGDRAFLPGPPHLWESEWVNVPATAISNEDIAHWPYTPGLLVKWVAFLGTLHWPAGGLDLGVGGISFFDLLILYELWAGERLSFEKAVPRYLRPGRPISVSAVPFGPGIDIWRSCRFIRPIIRSLCLLPGGTGRFVPCSIGAHHCRLWRIGWKKSGHGLTSGPRETASEAFLDELLLLFRYPPRSAPALLNGALPLSYCVGLLVGSHLAFADCWWCCQPCY